MHQILVEQHQLPVHSPCYTLHHLHNLLDKIESNLGHLPDLYFPLQMAESWHTSFGWHQSNKQHQHMYQNFVEQHQFPIHSPCYT